MKLIYASLGFIKHKIGGMLKRRSKMAKFTLAIMGATGRIGHYLAEELLKKGHKVRALGRDARKLRMLKEKGAQIFSGDFTDSALLSNIFSGCNAVFSFLPPGTSESDMVVFREKTGDAIVHAIAHADISHVVNLSSIGGHLPSGSGPITALHHQEERLNSLGKLNVLHFRAGYFMENLISMIPGIKNSGMITGAFKPDLRIPMVATQDISHKIAEFLDTLKFTGSSVFEFAGPQDITMSEATKIIGKAIGNPQLKYKQISYAEAEKHMIASGMKHQIAHLMVEMCRGFNEGKITPTESLTGQHRGKTTLEQFSKTFLEIYRSLKKAA